MPATANAEAARLCDASFGKAAYTAPTTPMMLALMTANGSQSAAGTEATGGSYARKNLTTATPANSTNGVLTSNAQIDFTNMPASTITGIEVYDSAGSPRRAWFGPLTANKTLSAGDTLSFASGALVFTLG